ncbi:TIGR01777 family oxidoreductase [Saprospira grandis]|uniref:TIGR01777 family protein n=1 Tax=Saprospira grandis (strain Lewin) TaxID=984262 RepID=H6L3G5_SAPGL|nr:TIGR01777 family oxidoreductase [Saprospira grandis]AFC23812.1 hypothetical protein SGRA_1077 [Saprospira grandis str. Lewin]
MSRILITGGSGLIGQELCKLLHQQGFEPILLSRNPAKITQWTAFEWDLDRGWVDPQLFDQPIDYLIHLAGAGIADARWSDQRKELIIDSRSQSLKILAQAFREARQELKAFISASAVGIYGDRGNEVLSEESAIHKERKDDFLVQSCIAWEDAAKAFEGLTARISHLRIGIVLSTRGGALAKMLPSYQFHLGAYFGDGEQYYPWVHISDLCRMFLFLIQRGKAGVYNGVGPDPVQNKTMAHILAKATGKKSLILPAPRFALRLAMGEMANVVLYSARVLPKRLEEEGFKHRYRDLQAALVDLIENKR